MTCPTSGCFTRRIPPFEACGYTDLKVKVLVGCASSSCPKADAEASCLTDIGDGLMTSCYTVTAPPGTPVAEIITGINDAGARKPLYSSTWNMPGLCESDIDNIISKLLVTDLCDPSLQQSKYWRDIRQNSLAMFLLIQSQNQNWVMGEDADGNHRMSLDVYHCGRVITTIYKEVAKAPKQGNCQCRVPMRNHSGCCNKCQKQCCPV